MKLRFRIVVAAAFVLLAAAACRTPKQYVAEPPPTPSSRSVVVWISIDGFRGDYVDRNVTPTLRRLMKEGVYSQKLVTITPSLTFPSHATEATGVPASEHGIPSNDFYDAASREILKMPSAPSLLQAEPIWLTAKRQGVRTVVFDWPMSYIREGPVKPDYSLPKFEGDLTDEMRLARLLDTWRNDANEKPLRLLMGYIKRTDAVGHKYGPDSTQINDAIRQTDAALLKLIDNSVELFDQKMKPGDQLYVLLTTDHGMTPVKTLVNAAALFPSPPPPSVRIITSGPLALVYLDQVPPNDRAGMIKTMLADLRKHDFVKAYTHETLPKAWRLDHPSRVGDITLMLDPGYTFRSTYPEVTHIVAAGEEPQGMHGYPPDKCPDMRGLMVIWRYPAPLGGRNLGTVHAEQIHPTVVRLLGIRPADDAKAAAVLER